ncbi:MAG TPA: cyclic nucleotide-binding domain-containing protein [Stellaceae bacterium]|nr:cyclic nucleotide-binding domain-containing protein [Stellaceae bacterium]
MNALAYVVSLLVLGTFGMRTMMPLRIAALASNVSLIAYSLVSHLYLVLLLQVILLPINLWRLIEIIQLARRLRGAVSEDSVFKALLPFAGVRWVKSGEVIMRKGESSDAMYLVLEGQLWVEEAAAAVGPGSIVGEIGVLSSSHRRTATVSAKSECKLGVVSSVDFQQVYYTDPALGLSLVRLIIDRLTRDVEAGHLPEMEVSA